MIYTNRKVTVRNGMSTIDAPVILYRGDKEVEIIFEIIDVQFKFRGNNGNLIDNTKASFCQLAIQNPDGSDLFTDIAACEDSHVIFKITGEMINEIDEVGFYSFHIRLFNEDQTSRITLPPVMEGIEIREPIAIESTIGEATVNYSSVASSDYTVDTFDADGVYNKTEWSDGDIISDANMNKIEDALYTINNKPTFSGNYEDLTNKPVYVEEETVFEVTQEELEAAWNANPTIGGDSSTYIIMPLIDLVDENEDHYVFFINGKEYPVGYIGHSTYNGITRCEIEFYGVLDEETNIFGGYYGSHYDMDWNDSTTTGLLKIDRIDRNEPPIFTSNAKLIRRVTHNLDSEFMEYVIQLFKSI